MAKGKGKFESSLKAFVRAFESDKAKRRKIYQDFFKSVKNLRDFLADCFGNGCIKKLIEAVKQKIPDRAKRDALLEIIS